MIHKVVNIAVPHRGTPLANVMLGDTSMINGDLGIKNLAYCVLKSMPALCSEVIGHPSQWKDLAVGSDVVSLPFPANVPMHFIYGDITSSLDGLEKIKEGLFLLFNLAKIVKTLRGRMDELEEAAAPLEEIHSRAILDNKIMDEATFKEVTKLLTRNNMLRLQAFLKAVLSIAQNGMSFIEMFTQSPLFTKLTQIGEIAGVAMGGAAGLVKTPFDLYFAIQEVIFSGQPHDFFVPKWSAVVAFPEYSTCFPVTPSIFDLWTFKYGEICHQTGVAEFVGYLLKAAPLSEFAVLKESVPLPDSAAGNSPAKTMKASLNGDVDVDFDNFYVKNFGLTIRKSTREDFGNGRVALKFIADAGIKTESDMQLVVQKDGLDRIFPMFTENGKKFETILVFTSADEGAMTAYCYAPSGKGNLYISDTVEFSCFDDFADEQTNENTPPEIITATLTNVITNQPYSFQLTASGTTPITWTHKGNLPAGLTLSESGLISGTPTKAGKYTFTVTASNSYGKSSQKYTLQVFDPVSVTTASLKAGTIGKSYSVTMRAKGTKTITWTAEGLPNGLSMNEKGRISGKPTVYGVFNVKMKAENGAGVTEKTLQLTVKAISPTLSGTLAKPTLNVPYSSGLKLSKGSYPVTWSIEGNLPGGLILDSSTGIISGTPTSYDKSGFKITITASNDAGRKSKKITIKVNGKAPKITAKLPGASAGENYSAELTATGSEPITFTADIPAYLTLNGSTISGTVPDSAKSFKITVYASNPVKEKVKKSYTVKVSAKKSLPQNLNADNDTGMTKNNTGINSGIAERVTARSERDVYLHSESIIIVAKLGEVSRDVSGMYDFEIEVPDYIAEGSELIYIANSDKPSEDDDIAEFYDDTGAEISAVPENRRITVSIWLNPETVYYPVIAVKD